MDYKLHFADVQFRTMKFNDISKVIWKPNSSSDPSILILGHSSFLCARYEVSDALYLMDGTSKILQGSQKSNPRRIYAIINFQISLWLSECTLRMIHCHQKALFAWSNVSMPSQPHIFPALKVTSQQSPPEHLSEGEEWYLCIRRELLISQKSMSPELVPFVWGRVTINSVKSGND